MCLPDVEQLSCIMTLIGLAAWLFHLERRPLAADDEHGPFDGVEEPAASPARSSLIRP
jgi:hypothetical protein